MTRLYFFLLLFPAWVSVQGLAAQDEADPLAGARQLYDKGKYAEVVKTLEKIDFTSPQKKGQAEMLMGDAEHKMEYFERAIKHYKSAEKAGIKTSNLYFHRGAAYISSSEYKKAVKDLNKAIGKNPEDATLYFYRAYAYTESGKSEDALADYTTAIYYNPAYAEAYYNRGAVKIDLGLLDEGEEDLEKAVELSGESFNASFNLAVIAYEKKEYAKARDLFLDLVQTEDMDQKLDAYYYLGECFYQLDDSETACRYFYKAMELGDADSEEIYHNFCEKGQLRKLFKERRKTEKVTF